MTYRRIFFSGEANALKASFDEFYNQACLRSTRLGLACILLLATCDALVTILTMDWWLHFLYIIPAFAVALSLSYTRYFKTYGQLILGIAFVSATTGYIWLVRFNQAADTTNITYHFRVILCVVGAAAVRLRFKEMLVATLAILAFYYFFLARSTPDIMNTGTLGGVCLIACAISASTERIMEDHYAAVVLLDAERARLKKINDKLTHSDTLKGKLLSIITHDLKGPTQNTAAVLKLLNSGQLTQDEFVSTIRKLETQLSGNQIILESLLKWSMTKIDDRITRETVDLRTLVEDCIYLSREPASRKCTTLVNNVQSIEIETDPEIVRIILRNLLSNAVKFTEEGTITCSHQQTGNLHVLTVHDTGVGMSQENVDRLFDWTRRISTRGTRDEKGTGIGLLISGEFLESIGGGIQIRSTPGKGTTVSLELRA